MLYLIPRSILGICFRKAVSMERIAKIKNKIKLNDNAMVYLLFVSVFLPYYITIGVMLFAMIYGISSKKTTGILEKNGGIWGLAFICYTSVVAIVNLNFIGFACSFGFFVVIIISRYIRRIISVYNFEKGLNIAIFCGVITSALCVIEFIYHQFILTHRGMYRCTLYFFNANYLATVLATVIIICGYKVLYHKGRPILYYSSALICILGAYLTGSMFVWVEVFIGCAALLLITRRHQMLSALFLLAGTGIIVLYCMPGILPRIQDSNITTDNRVVIWRVTLEAIKAATPIWGQGFLSYLHIRDDYSYSYPTAHSHSILLEPIISFGIIGSILLVIFFIYFYKRVLICRNAQNKLGISSLILALTCAILVHGTTDLTFIWIQTGLFYGIIFGSIGIEEKMLKLE